MVIWSGKLFFDRFFRSGTKRNKLKKAVDARTITWPEATGIFLAPNEDESLMLIRFTELLQPIYADSVLTCVGVAGSDAAAQALTRKIIEECYKQRGDVGVKSLKEFVLASGS